MPRYYCDYCDTYLTHDSPSVRKQHNAGYKHKANVRIYYQQYEAQQNQYLIDQKVKEHLGQAAAYQQVGAAYNQMRPRLPILSNPMMPPMSLMPGMRPPLAAMPPRPIPGYPGMPPMLTPPGAPPSMAGQVNPGMPPGHGQVNPAIPGQVNNGVPRPMPMMVPGSSGAPAPPQMYAPSMYQQASQSAPPPSGGFEGSVSNANAQAQDAEH